MMLKVAGGLATTGCVAASLVLSPAPGTSAESCVALVAAQAQKDATVDVRLQNLCDVELILVHCQTTIWGFRVCPSFDRLPARQTGTFLFNLIGQNRVSYVPPASYLSWCTGANCQDQLGESFRKSGGDPKSLGDFL